METHTDQQQQQAITSEGIALYVHLHPSYFGLVVFDHNQRKIQSIETEIHHREHPDTSSRTEMINRDELQSWIKLHSYLFNQPYEVVRICVSTSLFHLIDHEGLADDALFAVMNKFDEGSIRIRTDRIRDDMYVQYGINSQLDQLLCSHFESGSIHFGERGLLQLLSTESDLFRDGVYCQLLGQEASVVILYNSKLVFFNKYTVKNREDLLYYILLCFQAQAMDPNADHLFLSGLIEKASPMYELVYDYVRNVEFMELPGAPEIPGGQQHDGLSPHYFINLLSIR